MSSPLCLLLIYRVVISQANLWLLFHFQCPTTVVPFFGDQPFWGDRVYARGVGPAPIPVDEFSLDKLVAAIQFMLDPKVTNILLVVRNDNAHTR